MNAVEIEEAVSELARQPFDAEDFPFAFLRAFGRKDVELKRLKANNASDVPGGILRRDSLHMAVSAPGGAEVALTTLRESPKTAANRVKFILATDGVDVLAEECATGDFRSFPLPELDRHFGFFLPLAGISAVRQIKDNPIDVKAVGRLNKLYLELLRENPDWAKEAKRGELNRLMARLVFCFFAEDTGIFTGDDLFTASVRQFSEDRAGLTNTDQVLAQLFLAMATPTQHDGRPDGRYRQTAGVKAYADAFPYVNGGLFEEAGEVPRFSRAARNYLLHAGELDWREINPDIFGSMIQAVADDDERGSLGMHYTSVPNILKVLNPLFLDELREKLAEAGDSVRKLRALRRRLSRIRVFDPACGSGNFLVIAYRQMRDIEHAIVQRTGDDPTSAIRLTSFYGIEIKGFAAEIARLALLIAEFQADARLISQQAARSMVLPLHRSGQIHTGNALRLDWLEVCPPAAPVTEEWDLGGPTGRLALEEDGLGGSEDVETYICGNPPYVGARKQTPDQKSELASVYEGAVAYKDADYVSGWFLCALRYSTGVTCSFAFVSTSSVCQGEQVSFVWPRAWAINREIFFCHTPFKWANNASNNAGVFVVIVGVRPRSSLRKRIIEDELQRVVPNISPYLTNGPDTVVVPRDTSVSGLPRMIMGNMARDDGNLILSSDDRLRIVAEEPNSLGLMKPLVGTTEVVNGSRRYCFWLPGGSGAWQASRNITQRVRAVEAFRLGSKAKTTNGYAKVPWRFAQCCHRDEPSIVVPSVVPEDRSYVTPSLLSSGIVVTNLAYLIYDYDLWNISVIASQMHTVWSAAVSGRLGAGIRYTPSVCYHTFPLSRAGAQGMPLPLTMQDKADLARCAEDILLAREAHFPATIADLYNPEAMPDDLRRAHERNDETLERIYIGRRFRNDTERLEHLFALYTKVTASDAAAGKKGPSKSPRKSRPSEKAA